MIPILSLPFFSVLATLALAGEEPSKTNALSKCTVGVWRPNKMVPAEIVRGVDGDTVWIKRKDNHRTYSIRLLSIDTPETHFQGKSQGYWGDKAAEFTAKFLPAGTAVRVETDFEPCDKYRRVLGYIWKGKVNANTEIVRAGMAATYCIFPNIKYCDEMAPAMAENMDQESGIFSDESVDLPYIWRKKVQGIPFDKYVGDLETHEVYQADHMLDIKASSRIFFMHREDISSPYELIE